MDLDTLGGRPLVPKQYLLKNNFLKFEKTPLSWGFFLKTMKSKIIEFFIYLVFHITYD